MDATTLGCKYRAQIIHADCLKCVVDILTLQLGRWLVICSCFMIGCIHRIVHCTSEVFHLYGELAGKGDQKLDCYCALLVRGDLYSADKDT